MKAFYKNTKYEIYDDGQCYSYLSQKFLTPQLSVKYPTYNLIIDGKKKKVAVHRMVAETFLDNPENKPIINHKDGNTHNYHLSNLEWATAAENSKHACSLGLTPKGSQEAIYFIENLPNEEWLSIVDFPLYLVSNQGRVMNKRTKRLLKPAISAHGYKEVSLWKNNKGYTKQVHQLVYSHFANDFNLVNYVINHKDGNKINNNIENLEKITYQENNLHAVYTIKTNKSNKPVYQMDSEHNIINQFNSIAEASRKTGINNISRAIKSQRMSGGFYWKFINND